MNDTNWLLKIGKQYGVSGFLAIWLMWTNQRLSKVESELYKCYDNAYEINRKVTSSINVSDKLYAILPKKEKYVKEKMERKNA